MSTPVLAGRRILVTRALDDARRWARQLAEHGADPVLLPCVHTEPLVDDATQAALMAACMGARWLVLTSVRGATAVSRAGVLLAPGTTVAAVGSSTAAAVRRLFPGTPFVSRGGTSRALGEELLALLGAGARGQRVAVAVAEGGRDDVEQLLANAGALVTRVNVYRTIPVAPVTPRRNLDQEGIGDVLLASPSAVTGLLNQANVGAATKIFTIGPTTSAAASSAGLVVTAESAAPHLNGLMEAMLCTIGA